MRKSVRVAAIIAGVILTFGVTTPLTASPATADGFIACSVPPGYTFDFRLIVSRCIDGNGVNTGIRYGVIAPATGVWACRIPPGFTYTSVYGTDDCSGYPD